MVLSALILTLVTARSFSAGSSVAIFNGWKMQNKPIKFSWAPGNNETSNEIDTFENDDYFQVKWSCSVVYNKQMLIIGGMPVGADPPKVAYQIEDCGITATDIELPWAMGGHNCAVNNEKLYICSSEYNVLDYNCTVYDGKTFTELAPTNEKHVLGAMVSINGSLMIMGGELYQGKDTNTVEIYDEAKLFWVKSTPLPTAMRLFTALTVHDNTKNAAVYVFGGYRVDKNESTSATWFWNGRKWQAGPDMKSPREGHRTIAYMGGILHIGGADKTKIERWTPIKTGYKIEESQLTLDMYTDFPESFLVADNFCK